MNNLEDNADWTLRNKTERKNNSIFNKQKEIDWKTVVNDAEELKKFLANAEIKCRNLYERVCHKDFTNILIYIKTTIKNIEQLN